MALSTKTSLPWSWARALSGSIQTLGSRLRYRCKTGTSRSGILKDTRMGCGWMIVTRGSLVEAFT
jgi:hypothetical protein